METLDLIIERLSVWAKVNTRVDLYWFLFGIFAQMMFFMRFLVQWLVSEKHQRSTVPVAFWYFSIAGACALMTYGIQRGEPVIVLGQSFGFIVYIRNLMLIHRQRRREALVATATKVEPTDPDKSG